MRATLVFIVAFASFAGQAQMYSTPGFMNYLQGPGIGNRIQWMPAGLDKKWSVSSYAAVSTSFQYFNGGSGIFTSVPVGLQLNRRLNNNFYAFAGVAVAPAYYNFNHSFLATDIGKGYQSSFNRAGNFGMFTRAEMGLMYVNDARTFSVSGSIGVERNSYPLIPYPSAGAARQNNAATQFRGSHN